MQRDHCGRTEPIIERELGALPVAARLGVFGATRRGRSDHAAAGVVARTLGHPAHLDQRPQVAGEGGGIQAHLSGKRLRLQGAELDHMREQRKLRAFEAHAGELGIVVARHRAQQLPQLEVGATLRLDIDGGHV